MLDEIIRLIKVERVDDLPVVLAQVYQMQIPALLDQCYPTHGHWKGDLSFGDVVAVWLTFVVSEGDHCLAHVQPWVEAHLDPLTACLGKPVRPLDFSDDRLADLLDRLADAATWAELETALNGAVLRVYEVDGDRVRLDSTSAKTYAGVSEGGLFQFGQSKDHRPDLPQVKISRSALDALGLPLTTTVVSGNGADDPRYVPEIQRVQATLGAGGKTYIGDSKMGALVTRAWIARSGDDYLCPLGGKQMPEETLAALLAPVFGGAQPLEPVYEQDPDPTTPPRLIAEGYAVAVDLEATVEGPPVTWREQRLVVRSVAQATRQAQALDARLQQAVADIHRLNERQQGKKILEAPALTAAAAQILAEQRVVGLIHLDLEITTPVIHQRRYGARPATRRVQHQSAIRARIDPLAVAAAQQRLGWRVYATNHATLTVETAVHAYRGQYLIERSFGCLKPTFRTPYPELAYKST